VQAVAETRASNSAMATRILAFIVRSSLIIFLS
jgi:hypothetical protein